MADSRSRGSEVSLERAQKQAQQRLRLFGEAVLHKLDGEARLVIEINGVPVGAVPCMDSALAELAAGWAFMHRFCESPADFDQSMARDFRASVMVRGGVDILERRSILHGERIEHPAAPDPWPRDEHWSIPEDVLLDILREAWGVFQEERLQEGFVHAALANAVGVKVVAFDISAHNSVAKVLGWCLRQKHFPSYEILVVNGLVTHVMVHAAARLGVKIIASPHIPTAEAYKAARLSGMSIVAYMRHETVGLFGNPGLVTFDDDDLADT